MLDYIAQQGVVSSTLAGMDRAMPGDSLPLSVLFVPFLNTEPPVALAAGVYEAASGRSTCVIPTANSMMPTYSMTSIYAVQSDEHLSANPTFFTHPLVSPAGAVPGGNRGL